MCTCFFASDSAEQVLASHLQTHSWPIDDNDLSSFKQTFALSSQLLDLPSQPPLMEAV
ncbi:hypothetical protein CGMCC3_g12609 [Colletotrichum fructicola]|nr:uncharacterized protein CGMCC3_g12609 [Colletotrichum fructicola]KAE9571382.1 hypothetical protein CGMCC3_g12609 [Colletotrichum fructicola]